MIDLLTIDEEMELPPMRERWLVSVEGIQEVLLW